MAQADQELGFLDLLIIMAERAKLLVLGPVLVGLAAWGITLLWPPTYESTSWLKLKESAATEIQSHDVLATALEHHTWIEAGLGREAAIRHFQDLIDVRFNRHSGMVELVARAPTPQQARNLNQGVIDAYRVFSRPKGQDLEQANEKLKNIRESLRELQAAAKSLATTLSKGQSTTESSDDRGRSYVALTVRQLELQQTAFDLEQSLRGFGPEVYGQAPSLPERPVSPKKGLVVALAVVGSAILLLFGVLVLGAIQAAAKDSAVAEKLQKLKGSLGGQRRP